VFESTIIVTFYAYPNVQSLLFQGISSGANVIKLLTAVSYEFS